MVYSSTPPSGTPASNNVAPSPLQPPLQPLDIKKSGRRTSMTAALVLVGFGVAALVFYMAAQFVTGKWTKAKPNPAAAQVPVDKTVVEVVASPQATTAPAAPKVLRELPSLTLTGIMYSGEGSDNFVILNGKVLTEGTTISGAKVEKIGPDKVELSFDERTIILRSL